MILAAVGVVAAAGSAAAAILLPPGRMRAAAMLLALALSPLLILGDQWHTPQIEDLRDEPVGLLALALAAIGTAVLLIAAAFRRWPLAMPLAIVFFLPFRIPLEAGGDTANLLVPLYLVIAGGVLATAVRDWALQPASASSPFGGWASDASAARAGGVGVGVSGKARRPVFRPTGSASAAESQGEKPSAGPDTPTPATGPARLLPVVLAAVVVLYALQTLYSPDFSKSLQNVCFFFVPFSLIYALLRDVTWDRKLLALVLWVVALEAVAFMLVGSVEYATKSLFWNDQVIRSNEFHTYFRVNSIFWDPNIYGRYLALAIVAATAALLWVRERRTLALLTALIAVLWLGLVPTFSQSSFVALLGGLAVLAALRWSRRWTLAAVGAVAVLALAIVIFAGGVSKLSPDRLNVDTGGRTDLVAGGAKLFAQRPLWGYGAGSFPRAYRERVATREAPVAVSHTEPITVAAEQGLIGLAAYAALLLTAIWTMSSGLWVARAGGVGVGVSGKARRPVFRPTGSASAAESPGEKPSAGPDTPTPATGPARQSLGRAAVLAAFIALLVHTMAYAGFYEDPIAWVLLAVGAALAGASTVRTET